MNDKVKINQDNYNTILAFANTSNSINDLATKLGWHDYYNRKKLKALLLLNDFNINIFPNLNLENSIFNNEEKLRNAVKSSFSYTDVIKLFVNKISSGHYTSVKKNIQKFNLDISHFSPYKNENTKKNNKISNEDMFIINSPASASTIRNRVLKEKLIPYKCQCGNEGHWRNHKMTLDLEHKNGNKKDNRLENLEFLCPNCHSITLTYKAKNKFSNKRSLKIKKEDKLLRIKNKLETIKIKKIEDNKELILKNIDQYNSLIDILNAFNLPRNTKNYAALNNFLNENKNNEIENFLKKIDRKVEYPYLKKLKKIIQENGYAKVAEELGCSDRGLRKHIEKHTKKIVAYPDLPILKQMIAEKGWSQVARELDCSPKAIRNHISRIDVAPIKSEVKKVIYPDVNALITMVASKGFVQVGKELGCSDNAIRKHLKKNNIDIKSITINTEKVINL